MATFGETLKRERELRKITLREVSEATKIGLRHLEALEGNRFDLLPGGLFNKGFIRAYSKFIGLDGEAMVTAYLFDLKSQESPSATRPRYAGFSIEEMGVAVPPAEKKKAAGIPKSWWTAGAAGLGVLAVAASLWLFNLGAPARPHGKAARPKAAPEKAQIAVEQSHPAAGNAGAGAPPPAAPTPAATSPPASPAPEQTAANPPEGSDASGAAGKEAPQKPAGLDALSLILTASERTWIAIACDGTERLNKEISAGDSVRLSCREEIRLSSGNAGTITLQIGGNDCLPLGQRGEVIHDFIFNRERATELCPPPSQEP
jgi:cytoskeleton protein RodZ